MNLTTINGTTLNESTSGETAVDFNEFLIAKARSRIYWQYRNAPNMVSWLYIIPQLAQYDIDDPSKRISNILDIDKIKGDQLDVVARILGFSRPPIVQAVSDLTTFASDDEAPQFGEDGVQFSSTTETLGDRVSDDLLRALIKSRIVRNNGNATINNIVKAARFITGIEDVQVHDNLDMTWSIEFGQNLDQTTRIALKNFDLLPRPQGTRLTGFVEP